MGKFISFLYSFCAVATTALISAYFVNFGTSTFYPMLKMPPLTPPDRIFQIVWSILYTLMIISYYLILKKNNTEQIEKASIPFLGQLLLQIVWSYLFFYQAYFSYALIVMLLLIATVFQMIRRFHKIDGLAANLQYPYLLWLLLAAYLNIGAIYLNGNALQY